MVFLWNYLYKTGVVLRRGKCRGCGVGSGGSTMAALPIVRHWQGWLGLLHRLDAVARSVLLASVGCSSAVHEGCFVWQVLRFLGNKRRAALLPNALQGALWRLLGTAV